MILQQNRLIVHLLGINRPLQKFMPVTRLQVTRVLPEILIIADQHSLDQVGMIEEINVEPGGTVVKDIAKLRCPFPEYSERIGVGEWHVADGKSRLGARGALHGNG